MINEIITWECLTRNGYKAAAEHLFIILFSNSALENLIRKHSFMRELHSSFSKTDMKKQKGMKFLIKWQRDKNS